MPGTGPVSPATLAAWIEEKARWLVEYPYEPAAASLPAPLLALDYEQYRAIRFRPEAALWRGGARFELQLMHSGFIFDRPVRLHVLEAGEVKELRFDPGFFEYEGPAGQLRSEVEEARGDVGFSGFRVHYPLNDPAVQDEVTVFQGASYFRLVGPGHAYGLSSRGLAIDLGGEEEFPDFTEFWFVRPEPNDTTLSFHALLDSPSVVGTYRFELIPGSPTRLAVDAHLYARKETAKLGVAPLSSMYLHGSGRSADFDDFRPEVHDSDGLLLRTGRDEWIWRPLSNRSTPVVTALLDVDPQGFGLVQRARDFDRYLDAEAQYHRRPSEWVRTLDGDWGAGSVQLLEMPTDSEFRDNIAAAWVPDVPFRAGEERRYVYELVMFDARLDTQPLAQVVRTGIGGDGLPGQASAVPRSRRRFIVDFRGGKLDELSTGEAPEATIETSAGQITDVHAIRLPDAEGWRVSFRLDPDGDAPADMRLYLEREGRRLSETWSYVWFPAEAGQGGA